MAWPVALAALLALAPAPALADTDSETAAPSNAATPVVAPVELAALLLPSAAPVEVGGAAITIGRDQDIVGVPIDFSRIEHSPSGRTVRRGLPATAAMPTGLPLASGRLTSGYGMRWHPIRGGWRSHNGIDLAAASGTPIHASAAGLVSAAGWAGGYGIAVTIDHGGGLQTSYGHMSRLAVAPGQYVAAGTVIGYVGSTGLSTGPHLHYEVRANGQPIDPLSGR